MAQSGFYTNRISFSEMIEFIRAAGFRAEVIKKDCRRSVPLSRKKLAPEFSDRSDEDLLVRDFLVLCQPL
jgi:hypothetical protein